MKNYVIILLAAATIFSTANGFAQTGGKSPCTTMTNAKPHHKKHYGKSIAHHHHAIKRHPVAPVTPTQETITMDDHSATAIVSIKDGNVYVNDSLVTSIKNPKCEDHRLIINYITPPPPPPAPVTVVEHVATNTYTGEKPSKGMLGVSVMDDCATGARIGHIISCSPAAKAGLYPGDVITKVDDRTINNADELLEALGTHNAGDNISVTVKDYDGTETKQIVLAKEDASASCGCHTENYCCRW